LNSFMSHTLWLRGIPILFWPCLISWFWFQLACSRCWLGIGGNPPPNDGSDPACFKKKWKRCHKTFKWKKKIIFVEPYIVAEIWRHSVIILNLSHSLVQLGPRLLKRDRRVPTASRRTRSSMLYNDNNLKKRSQKG